MKAEIVELFNDFAADAETDASEDLFLGRLSLGYVGDPMEFRASSIYARRLPGEKSARIHDYVAEYSKSPHNRLRRPLTAKEADWMLREADKLYKDELAHVTSVLAAHEASGHTTKRGRQLDVEIAEALNKPRRTRTR